MNSELILEPRADVLIESISTRLYSTLTYS